MCCSGLWHFISWDDGHIFGCAVKLLTCSLSLNNASLLPAACLHLVVHQRGYFLIKVDRIWSAFHLLSFRFLPSKLIIYLILMIASCSEHQTQKRWDDTIFLINSHKGHQLLRMPLCSRRFTQELNPNTKGIVSEILLILLLSIFLYYRVAWQWNLSMVTAERALRTWRGCIIYGQHSAYPEPVTHRTSVCDRLTFSILWWSSLVLASHSCRSLSKRSSRSALSRPHLFSPCCSFQRRSNEVLWLSARRRRCSSRSWFRVHSASRCASPRVLPPASNWHKEQQHIHFWSISVNVKSVNGTVAPLPPANPLPPPPPATCWPMLCVVLCWALFLKHTTTSSGFPSKAVAPVM